MNTALIILAVILALIGIAGSVIPGLPGPPLSWAALLLLNLTTAANHSPLFLAITAAAAVAITLIDYIIPSLSTKRHGGSKAGVWGCNIGLFISIIGFPFGPQGLIGIIFWPFVGAWVGELIGGKRSKEATRAAWGAFVGFLTGTGLKLAYSLIATFFIAKDLLF